MPYIKVSISVSDRQWASSKESENLELSLPNGFLPLVKGAISEAVSGLVVSSIEAYLSKPVVEEDEG